MAYEICRPFMDQVVEACATIDGAIDLCVSPADLDTVIALQARIAALAARAAARAVAIAPAPADAPDPAPLTRAAAAAAVSWPSDTLAMPATRH